MIYTPLAIRFLNSPFTGLYKKAVLYMAFKFLPSTLTFFASKIASNLFTIITSFGFIQALKILNRTIECLVIKAVPEVIRDILYRSTNSVAAEKFYTLLSEYWPRLIRSTGPVLKFFRSIRFILIIFMGINPIFKWVIKTILISIFTVLGYTYIPLLQSFKLMRKIVTFILSFLPSSWISYLPKSLSVLLVSYWPFTKNIKPKSEQIRKIKASLFPDFGNDVIAYYNNYTPWYKDYKTYLGIIALAIVILLTFDYYNPDYPYIGAIAMPINYMMYLSLLGLIKVKSAIIAGTTAAVHSVIDMEYSRIWHRIKTSLWNWSHNDHADIFNPDSDEEDEELRNERRENLLRRAEKAAEKAAALNESGRISPEAVDELERQANETSNAFGGNASGSMPTPPVSEESDDEEEIQLTKLI